MTRNWEGLTPTGWVGFQAARLGRGAGFERREVGDRARRGLGALQGSLALGKIGSRQIYGALKLNRVKFGQS